MAISRIVIGKLKEATHTDTLKASVAEFISMFIYVFSAEGFAASSSLTSGESTLQAQLIAAAINHAFVLVVVVFVAINISGGHVNPTITFGLFLGGHITFIRCILYWIAQLFGSVVACLLLKYSLFSVKVSPFPPTPWSAVVFEIVMTFGLVYTVYATLIDKKSKSKVISPIAVGFIVGANILSGGVIYGAAMNPASPFGQAVVSWTWNNHWVYWLGTFVGAAIASLVYQTIFIVKNTDDEQLPISINRTNFIKGDSIQFLHQKLIPCL